MTQNDLDKGRMICLVGIASTRPAEFVIFRGGQWTADANSGTAVIAGGPVLGRWVFSAQVDNQAANNDIALVTG